MKQALVVTAIILVFTAIASAAVVIVIHLDPLRIFVNS